ncbi:MAG: tetraacyldisaccharide 4'-kinase [Acidobacteriota bacterium]
MSARRPWAWPLVPVYAAALALKERLRSSGILSTRKLQWPVVSVGSVSAGGAGKTPVVIALATMLKQRGWSIDILSRGYGREGLGIELVDTEEDAAAKRFGDEPTLIGQRTHLPVWVGSDRFAAGQRAEAASAEEQIAQGLHLLDDGFQHRKLARTVDIVLVTAEDIDDALLPAGNLREPLSVLGRADFVVIRQEETEAIGSRVQQLMRRDAQLWTIRRKLRFPAPLFVFGAGLRPIAFCAIARPAGFASMLIEAGCGIVETVFFGDHHAYAMADIDRIIEVAKELNATGLVTTEKDAVKLTTAMREKLEAAGPLMVAELEVEFIFPERVMRELETRLV